MTQATAREAAVAPVEKRKRHASAQANYMERKRAEGKEWLATWVPADARDTFKALAEAANADTSKPDKDHIKDAKALAKRIGEKVPKWAKDNSTLLQIWLLAHAAPGEQVTDS